MVEYCPEKCIAYMENIDNAHDYDYFRARAHTGSEERGELGFAVFCAFSG